MTAEATIMGADRNYWAGRSQGKRQATHAAQAEIRELTDVVDALQAENARLKIALVSIDPDAPDPWMGREGRS
jgi:hypothetical protein